MGTCGNTKEIDNQNQNQNRNSNSHINNNNNKNNQTPSNNNNHNTNLYVNQDKIKTIQTNKEDKIVSKFHIYSYNHILI